MSATPLSTDSDLLGRYERDGSETAFRVLVERYQSMVLGAAYRRTGNLELARDVAQEVFAALARKGRWLAGRASLGGWLHQAAVYESLRALQSETRRHARHDRFSSEAATATAPAPAGPDRLALVDEAIGQLSAADREVLVLHYFQDLSYVEMAAALGANEAAVRQRVSRAIERLGKRLREHGVGGAVAAVLLAAVAIQGSLAAPTGLARAALLAAAAGGGASAFLLLTALLSPTAVRSAALALALAGAISLTQWPLIQTAAASTLRPSSVVVPPAQSPTDFRAPLASDAARSPAAEPARMAAPARRAFPVLAATSAGSPETPAVPSAPPRIPPVVAAPRPAPAAVVPIVAKPAPATVAAVLSPPAPALPEAAPISSRGLPPPALAAPVARAAGGLLGELLESGGVPDLVAELRRIERVPAEAATLYGAILEDALALEPVRRLRVEAFLRGHFERLNADGRAGVRPAAIPEAQWLGNREAAVATVVKGVGEVLADAAPDPKVLDEVFTLAEKAEPVAEATKPVEAAAGTVAAKVQAVLAGVGKAAPLAVPLLP